MQVHGLGAATLPPHTHVLMVDKVQVKGASLPLQIVPNVVTAPMSEVPGTPIAATSTNATWAQYMQKNRAQRKEESSLRMEW